MHEIVSVIWRGRVDCTVTLWSNLTVKHLLTIIRRQGYQKQMGAVTAAGKLQSKMLGLTKIKTLT